MWCIFLLHTYYVGSGYMQCMLPGALFSGGGNSFDSAAVVHDFEA